MWKMSIFFLTFNFCSFGQTITVIDKSDFKVDNLVFTVSGIKYIKKINKPFVHGGDGKFARKSQITFQLKKSSYLSVFIGDSLYIEELVRFRKNETEYYSFSNTVTENQGKRIYTYSYTSYPGKTYQAIFSSLYIKNTKYFILVDTDSKNLKYGFKLLEDLGNILKCEHC